MSDPCKVVLTSFGLELMAVEYAAWVRYVQMNLPKAAGFPVEITASRHNAGYTDIVISSESSYEMMAVNTYLEVLYGRWRKASDGSVDGNRRNGLIGGLKTKKATT